MKPSIEEAINFINSNINSLNFYTNMYGYVVFSVIKDDEYSLEKSRFSENEDYGFQLCSKTNRKDSTTLFFKLSDIIQQDKNLGEMITNKLKNKNK